MLARAILSLILTFNQYTFYTNSNDNLKNNYLNNQRVT